MAYEKNAINATDPTTPAHPIPFVPPAKNQDRAPIEFVQNNRGLGAKFAYRITRKARPGGSVPPLDEMHECVNERRLTAEIHQDVCVMNLQEIVRRRHDRDPIHKPNTDYKLSTIAPKRRICVGLTAPWLTYAPPEVAFEQRPAIVRSNIRMRPALAMDSWQPG